MALSFLEAKAKVERREKSNISKQKSVNFLKNYFLGNQIYKELLCVRISMMALSEGMVDNVLCKSFCTNWRE